MYYMNYDILGGFNVYYPGISLRFGTGKQQQISGHLGSLVNLDMDFLMKKLVDRLKAAW